MAASIGALRVRDPASPLQTQKAPEAMMASGAFVFLLDYFLRIARTAGTMAHEHAAAATAILRMSTNCASNHISNMFFS